MEIEQSAGPLTGVRVLEVGSIGPGPFAGMLLSDMGADVLRLHRGRTGSSEATGAWDVLNRGRRELGIDLKHPDAKEVVLRIVEACDVLIEGFRPGVAERLGIGPESCLARNPRLIYGRMTGWGQEGSLAARAGHDINYIALTGALHAIGRAGESPVPPLNLVGDFGGGGILLAFGVACALWERERSGLGQVIDAAMVDGAAQLMAAIYGLHAVGRWSDQRGENLLDTGAPFYDVYRTSDGRYVAVGALEPQFYRELLDRTGLDYEKYRRQMDRSLWPALRQELADAFLKRTRDEWSATFSGVDACVSPVLGIAEAPSHPHNASRGTFTDRGGVIQPTPAPRFSRTPGTVRWTSGEAGSEARSLATYGFADEEMAQLQREGVLR